VFFRVANGELQVAANYRSPKYLKSLIVPENPRATQRPKHIRGLLFAARTNYINDIAPFIFTSEEAFNEEFRRRNIAVIGPFDAEKRKLVYNLPALNGKKLEQCHTHLWSRALYIHQRVQWSYPCFRCHFLHKSMDNFATAGQKSVEWRKEFAPLNCAESLSLAMVLKYDRDDGRMYD
jgi:hypothetical protein